MARATLRGILAHRLRLLLAAVAIVLGVSFVSGTLVLSDTLNATFDNLFRTTTAGVDVQVRARSTISEEQRPPVKAAVLDQVRRVDGVSEAAGRLQRSAGIVGSDGKVIQTGGAPTLGLLWDPYPDLSSLHLRQGRPPASAAEVVIDVKTANDHHIAVGQTVRILLPEGAPRPFRVTGVTGFGDQDNFVGATIAAFDTTTGPALLGSPGEYDALDAKGRPGVGQEELRARIGAVVPSGLEAVTGQSAAQEQAGQVAKGIGFLTTTLIVFALVSLFVGSFIILNTFSILVAQRQKELALLRCLGASRAQVLGSVLLEALIIGLVASAAGVAAGVLIAMGLQKLLGAIGITISGTALQLQAHTVVVGMAVGTLVTVLAAVLPARRATRVAPVEAMRDAVPPASEVSLRRVVIGVLLLAAGVGALAYGLFAASSNQLQLTGVGAFLVFIGVAVLAPIISVPIVQVLGLPIARWRGVPGQMARENALRQPRRTAATASALMIGVGLVGAFAVMAASFKDSVSAVLDRTSRADLILTSETFSRAGLTPAAAQALRADRAAIAAVTEIAGQAARINGQQQEVTALDPTSVGSTLVADVRQGAPLSALGDEGVAISDDVATSRGFHVGELLSMEFERPGGHNLRVVTVYGHNPLLGGYIITLSTYRAGYLRNGDQVVLVSGRPGRSADQLSSTVHADLAAIPGVKIQTIADYKRSQAQQIDQILGFLTALLVLALVIALLGIVNTLVLSIVERTRELGLVRALGMEQAQMRTMVRWESVIIALVGTCLGLVIGIGFGIALVRALREQGVEQLAIPGGQLVLYVLIALVAGLLAAIAPARRAARINMLRAITTE